MSELKYKTLAGLKAAYDSGELSRDDSITLDNDSTAVCILAGDDYTCVFDGGSPDELIEEALTLLGIPWENA